MTDTGSHAALRGTTERSAGGRLRAADAPALLLGAGLGGLFDGIVMHQLLQWHHLLSSDADHPVNTVTGLEANTVADGIFHLGSWVVVVLAVLLLLRGPRLGQPSSGMRPQIGLAVAGWGFFNVAEGTLMHLVLGAHHVRDDTGGPLVWDLGYLLVGVVMTIVGVWIHRRSLAEPVVQHGIEAEPIDIHRASGG